MRVIVTGATSFIGSATVKCLLGHGHEVIAVVRPHSSNEANLVSMPGLKKIYLDASEIGGLPQLTDRADAWLQMSWSGIGSEGRSNPDIQKQNIENGLKAVQVAEQLGCRRFVFTGSQAEYGIHQDVMTEESECHPVSEYGKAKLQFGSLAKELCSETGNMAYIHARIFSVYGPGDHPWSLVSSSLGTWREGGHMTFGECTQQWNFLYIDDAAEALRCLLEGGKAGIYNIASDDTRVLTSFIEEMFDICGRRGSYEHGKRPPRAEGPASLIPSIDKVKKMTNWRPVVSFVDGINRTIKEKKCLVCGHRLPEETLFSLEQAPASAQDIPDGNEVKSDQGITLDLYQCPECGTVQLGCDAVWYYHDVIRAGGFSTTMTELRRSQYRHLIETYKLQDKRFIEIGCGRGEFIKVLEEFPVKVYGIEHKEELVNIARQDGLNVWKDYAEDPGHCIACPHECGATPFDVFLSFNFLEHQPHPADMLRTIYNNLSDDGMGLVTVPSLEYILSEGGYYELLRDHLAYYTFESLRMLLENNGFQVLEEDMINRDTLSMIVKKKPRTEALPAQVMPVDVTPIVKTYTSIRKEMKDYCAYLKAHNMKLAIWGAGHQGFTLTATTCLKDEAMYIVDSAPFKQGRFAPSSHLPIIAPKEALESEQWQTPDAIMIVAPGYSAEIAKAAKELYGEQTEIVTMRARSLEWLTVHR